MGQPKIFIASSSKALNYATAVQKKIGKDFDAIVWEDEENYPAKTITDWVLNLTEKFDFGVFIFSNDDKAVINNKEHEIVRDNVLFELGLFSGKLGFDRCFIIRPKVDNFHLPSDLTGILEFKFKIPNENNPVDSVLRSPCEDIKREIEKRWKDILKHREKEVTPERIAAICYQRNPDNGLVEFLLVESTKKNPTRLGFPKKPFEVNDSLEPIEVAIQVAAEEGGVKVQKVEKAPELKPFKYKKEGDKKVVNYTPFLLEVIDTLEIPEKNIHRKPQFHSLGEIFTKLRSNRNDSESIKSLERVICQCYDFLLRD